MKKIGYIVSSKKIRGADNLFCQVESLDKAGIQL